MSITVHIPTALRRHTAGTGRTTCSASNLEELFSALDLQFPELKPHLRDEALYMLRFHSFYPWHRHGAYDHLCNDKDRAMLEWVLKFNQYDLYSKGHAKPDTKALKPYYDDLFAEFLPEKIDW